jgi:DNA-binding PadR family transcriptional regulator
MIATKGIEKYLPLSESTIYIVMSLTVPRHGYALMQHVKEISKGTVKLGPGTLYGALSTLEKVGIIRMVSEENRRKSYVLTDKGEKVLALQAERIAVLNQNIQIAIDSQ